MTTRGELTKAIKSLDKILIKERDSLKKRVCPPEREAEILNARQHIYEVNTGIEEIEVPLREISKYNSKIYGMGLAFKAIADTSGFRFNRRCFQNKYSA